MARRLRAAAVLAGRHGSLAWRLGVPRHHGGRRGFAWLGRHDPELLKERMRPPFQREQLPQDKLLMGTFLPLWLGWYVLMGLDRRLGWSSVPVSLQILGAVLLCLGIWLSWQVLKENSYAAPVVKVQKERGHKVVTTGPYAYVRHPMYSSE